MKPLSITIFLISSIGNQNDANQMKISQQSKQQEQQQHLRKQQKQQQQQQQQQQNRSKKRHAVNSKTDITKVTPGKR